MIVIKYLQVVLYILVTSMHMLTNFLFERMYLLYNIICICIVFPNLLDIIFQEALLLTMFFNYLKKKVFIT